MWELDLDIQKVRGAIQGWIRGFYKNYDYQIEDKCIGKDTVKWIQYIKEEFKNMESLYILEMAGLFYHIYYTFNDNCSIEQVLYDLSTWCFSHDCDPKRLLENEMASVF